jgi:hypothetical protein
MAELRSRMPYADLDRFDRDRRLAAVPELFTVDLLTRYIAWKLGRGAATDPRDPAALDLARSPLTARQA